MGFLYSLLRYYLNFANHALLESRGMSPARNTDFDFVYLFNKQQRSLSLTIALVSFHIKLGASRPPSVLAGV